LSGSGRHLTSRLLLAFSLAAGAWATAAAQPCPPQAQAPTPQQVQAAMANAVDRGFLWRADKDGRTSFLYGTVHLAKFDWMFPGPAVHEALLASETVALELDMLDPDVQRRLGAAASSPPAQPVGEELAARLKRQAAAACIDDAALARFSPLMQVMSLSVLAARGDGLDPAYGIDVFLAGFARGAGKKVASLETPESQMQALQGSDPAQTHSFVMQGLEDLEAGRTAPRLVQVAKVWADSDLERLANYAQWCECMDKPEDRALYQRLLEGRNPALAERIMQLHGSSQGVFAAVGALHMTGPLALPALLRERGFRVEQVDLRR
jgi:uncharacterized protein